MREKLENKINDIIDAIIAKNPAEITYNEYRILDAKLRDIKYEAEQKAKNEEMATFMARNIFNCCGTPSPLPDGEKEG